jgi:hypothetical protein
MTAKSDKAAAVERLRKRVEAKEWEWGSYSQRRHAWGKHPDSSGYHYSLCDQAYYDTDNGIDTDSEKMLCVMCVKRALKFGVEIPKE